MSKLWLSLALLALTPTWALAQAVASTPAAPPAPAIAVVAVEPAPVASLASAAAPVGPPSAAPLEPASDTPAEPAPVSAEPVRYRLDNGLTVVLQRDTSRPRVAVAMSYHVGSRDDPEGYRGLAHLTEHMMFEGMAKGTGHSFDSWLGRAGATHMNGTTSRDRTTYYEELPSSEVKLGVWLEAVRMAYLLSWADAALVERARAAVLHEHEGHASSLSTMLHAHSLATLYPEGHPYHRFDETPDDIEAIQLEHVQWFFQRWYGPDNATLAIVGNFEVATLKDYIASTLGRLKRSGLPHGRAGQAPVTLSGTHRIDMRWRYASQSCVLTWPVPVSASTQDDRALDVLSTHLTQALNERALGHDTLREGNSCYLEGELSGEFRVAWQMEKEADAEKVQREVEALLASARSKLLTSSELVSAREPYRRRWLLSRENLLGRALHLVGDAGSQAAVDSHEARAAQYADVHAEHVVVMCAAFRDNAPKNGRVRRRFVAARGDKP
jgi:zinc protease